ncbi:hypothetical protein [Acinetobacter sp. ANC 3791]|uniref:hypothetical protein n=1 Tax=Acinetobacter sp. ANC 3791 TaxID=2529836 RepID=UPI00103CA972|nr:hypothetical protein [Acinetobacter sp. ANC 3791]TCB85422.1 hypothetical protein E0H90_05545 [Acinetobacter sp. ANC 3791]
MKEKLPDLWGYLKMMLPFVLLVLLLMFLWVSLLSFLWTWVSYSVLGIEAVAAIFVLFIEYGGMKVQGAAGWTSFGFVGLSLYFAFLLGLIRLIVWCYFKFIS